MTCYRCPVLDVCCVSILNDCLEQHRGFHCVFSPVPIIDSVEVAVLSLFEVEVNVSLLTNGGQCVAQYTVSWFTCVLSRCVFEQRCAREYHGWKRGL